MAKNFLGNEVWNVAVTSDVAVAAKTQPHVNLTTKVSRMRLESHWVSSTKKDVAYFCDSFCKKPKLNFEQERRMNKLFERV